MLYVIDVEADSLDPTLIHVMSVGYKDEGEWKVVSIKDYSQMEEIVADPNNTIVGHFFKMFDVQAIEKVVGCKVEARVIDTLALSWYTFPTRVKSFGLDAFGKDYGIEKPKIDDWKNLKYEDYRHRCEEDVKINIALWEDILVKLGEVYDKDEARIDGIIRYLNFKMDCLAEQQRLKCRFDVDKIDYNIGYLQPLLDKKTKALQEAMPLGKVIKAKPKNMYKKDGTISALGQKWLDFVREKGLPLDAEEFREKGNPSSSTQVKDWLFSLGWEPKIFKDGVNGPVPQLRNDDKELCDSVLKLAEGCPAIENLDGMTVIKHRLGILEGFLNSVDEDGLAVAGALGYTNTLRLKHVKPIVNLPGVTSGEDMPIEQRDLRDGRTIRECVIAPEGYKLCGSDISSLEDMTKRHYMWKYDSQYVLDQSEIGYDPHLEIGKVAGMLDEYDVQYYKDVKSKKITDVNKDKYQSIHNIRHISKTVNYSATYGVGASTLSKNLEIPRRKAQKILDAYWDRNWSLRRIAKDTRVKEVDGQMWLLNPVNKFWYSLRGEKDIFSTLNQGTGSYVFDCWIKFMMDEGVIPFVQVHDEIVTLCKSESYEDEERLKRVLKESMSKVNELLKLNVNIEVDVQFGNSYADVH